MCVNEEVSRCESRPWRPRRFHLLRVDPQRRYETRRLPTTPGATTSRSESSLFDHQSNPRLRRVIWNPWQSNGKLKFMKNQALELHSPLPKSFKVKDHLEWQVLGERYEPLQGAPAGHESAETPIGHESRRLPGKRARTSGPGESSRASQPKLPADYEFPSDMSPESIIRHPMLIAPPIEGNSDCRARPFHSELYFDQEAIVTLDFYQSMTTRGVPSPTAIHFTIDGRHGINFVDTPLKLSYHESNHLPTSSEPLTPIEDTILVEDTTTVEVQIPLPQEATTDAIASNDPQDEPQTVDTVTATPEDASSPPEAPTT
uniref:Uncharacterized protein n=1 Tax=Vitis vinifera TaxID=29760 RepID=A5BDA5_VITVI|nr:hypothetical protein VITISV_029981 [Vitis vinifera]